MTDSAPSSSAVAPKAFPLMQRLLSNPVVIAEWLALLVVHGQIVEGLGGVVQEGRIGRHIRLIVTNLLMEMRGEDDGSSARAIRQHTLKDIFGKYPEAMQYVLYALGRALDGELARQATEAGGRGFNELELEESLVHFAKRHGIEGFDPIGTIRKVNIEIDRIRGKGLLLTDVAATVFWDVALEPDTLKALGVPASGETIDTIVGHLFRELPDGLGVYFSREGLARRAQLSGASAG